MARTVTLFTGQWADLPLEQLAPLAKPAWATTGWNWPAGATISTCRRRLAQEILSGRSGELLEAHGLGLLGRFEPPGRPGGLRPHRRAAQGDPAAVRVGRRRSRGCAPAGCEAIAPRPGRAAFFDAEPAGARATSPAVVNGFTGSSIWHSLYAFPPTSQEYWEKGFARLRPALWPDPGRVREGGREFRAGSASHRDRLRHRLGAERADRRGRAATSASASITTPATSPTRASTTWPSSAGSPPASSTCT